MIINLYETGVIILNAYQIFHARQQITHELNEF